MFPREAMEMYLIERQMYKELIAFQLKLIQDLTITIHLLRMKEFAIMHKDLYDRFAFSPFLTRGLI